MPLMKWDVVRSIFSTICSYVICWNSPGTFIGGGVLYRQFNVVVVVLVLLLDKSGVSLIYLQWQSVLLV